MKKVLMVAHQFPPVGGSGVQRTAKFVKYLRDFRWEPIVFTRDAKGLSLKDESLLADIPAGVKVVRTAPWDFSELSGIFGLGGKLLNNKLLIPDEARLWQIFGRSGAVKTLKDEGIQTIYTTSYPYSDHLMGLYLKRKFPHIAWVADFRDEWTNNPYILDNPRNVIRSGMERKMEKDVLAHADCLVTNTPVMMKNFVRNNPETEGKFHVIPNGYDEEDFKDTPREKPDNEKFTLTYTGALYGRRKPDIFFEAVRNLIEGGSIGRDKLLIKLIGNFKAGYLDEQLRKFDLQGVVEVLPYMEHKECIRHLMKSDALLLIEGGGRGSEAFYTGKVFEYMNTGRPILAVIPAKGAAAQLIQETRTGYVSDCEDTLKTGQNLLTLYNQWVEKSYLFSPNWDLIQRFERKSLTKELANVLEKAHQISGSSKIKED